MGIHRNGLKWSLAVLSLLGASACDPFHTEFESIEDARYYTAAQLTAAAPTGPLRVMTYNVKFGGGRIDFFFDCHGDRVLMTESETLRNLQGIAEKIRAASPAVVFLQEVDVLSKRAAYLDQLQWLLDHSELNYAVYASQWRSDYVPSDGLGPVDSGNAILSLYPLSDVVRLALPLRGDQDALTQYFYLKRNILKARVRVGDSSVVLLNTHTSAYSQDGTKHTQLQRFESEMTSASDEGSWVIGGGDLNAIPPGSVDTHNFAARKTGWRRCTNDSLRRSPSTTIKPIMAPTLATRPQARSGGIASWTTCSLTANFCRVSCTKTALAGDKTPCRSRITLPYPLN